MKREGHANESQFISLPLRADRAMIEKTKLCGRKRNQSVLTMLLDKYYNQKENSAYCQYNPPSNGVPPLKNFLMKFGLASFYPRLAQIGYRDSISSFFFIPESCFEKTLNMLKANIEEKKIFWQLRTELKSLRKDGDSSIIEGDAGSKESQVAPCKCCKRENRRKHRLNDCSH